ncbi:hypothetical protein BBBOND_0103360 [Babesia bigemina]|uniref:Uncharacterized protein n=1 Tax=Babesia bigemina TaxID=5866 RepID=A0A061D4Y3_BABBI|nr:hypothetical protein BBBOND_0103360 [Babesia bigemina]CDR94019.1 hypothetical protein BBBOND_0103360 [Babesia bigemina]|eukprot:XP_012766205.1 hypothetical protein BBBOND_0103360 [Babesia bigemina]
MFLSRTPLTFAVAAAAFLGASLVEATTTTDEATTPLYVCNDPNDSLCLFCRRYAKAPHEAEPFPSTFELKSRLVDHLKAKLKAVGATVMEEVSRGTGVASAQMEKICDGVSFIAHYVIALDVTSASPLSKAVRRYMHCLHQGASRHVKEFHNIVTKENVTNLKAVQAKLRRKLLAVESITTVDLGDVMGSRRCHDLLSQMESCCATYVLRQGDIDVSQQGRTDTIRSPYTCSRLEVAFSVTSNAAAHIREQRRALCSRLP